ncbi:hybrid sensor histidine kinase/response regulator [Chitinolyticbacter albus]|uniref:hybrid sensor histidine kinase/response regulator n=1 Tax=Chitinolyticbacter albus TaxID=2961951 RepID=UPI00210C85E2|nr:ATP-binding protein [Chitinolyticbacter albus]
MTTLRQPIPRRVRTAFWVTLCVLGGILALTIWCEYQLRERLAGVTDFSTQDESWNTFSLNREFMRFSTAARLARHEPERLAELTLRYDILVSRVVSTQNGAMKSLFGEGHTYSELLAPINRLFTEFDPRIVRGLTPADLVALNRTLDRIEPQVHLAIQELQARFSDRLLHNEKLIVTLGDWRIALQLLQFLLMLLFAAIALREVWRSERRSGELDAARADALTASAAKTRFLASISHEMRTPLTAIIGYSEQLLNNDGLAPEQRRHLEHVRQSSHYLSGLIGNVLDVAKIEAGSVQLSEETITLSELADDLHAIFESQALAQHTHFSLTVSNELPPYLALDGRKLRQILINLIGNALKFTANGIVVAQLDGQEDADGLLLRARIRDTGLGIGQDELVRLFNPFEQTQSGKLVGGTGLGLYISQDYARRMGGEITVDSTQGHGSTFTLTVRATAAAAAPTVPDSGPTRLDGLKLLIADDQDINLQLMRDILTAAGAEVRAVDNGLSVLDELSADPDCDCVLLDYNMPGLDGLAASRALRARGWAGRIVLVSAGLKPQGELAAQGVNLWLAKPFTIRSLTDAVFARQSEPASLAPSPLLCDEEQACKQLGCTAERWRELAQRGLARIDALLADYTASDDADTRRRHAHSARGIALQIGANLLAQRLAELEATPSDALHAAASQLCATTRGALSIQPTEIDPP